MKLYVIPLSDETAAARILKTVSEINETRGKGQEVLRIDMDRKLGTGVASTRITRPPWSAVSTFKFKLEQRGTEYRVWCLGTSRLTGSVPVHRSIQTLKREAAATAKSRGHRLKWRPVERRDSRPGQMQIGKCKCGCSVLCLTHPAANEIHISGDALALNHSLFP